MIRNIILNVAFSAWADYRRLIYVYSVISVKLDALLANTKM